MPNAGERVDDLLMMTDAFHLALSMAAAKLPENDLGDPEFDEFLVSSFDQLYGSCLKRRDS